MPSSTGKAAEVIRVTLSLASGPAEGLFVLLQRGFKIRTATGTTITEFLMDYCGVDHDYISGTVSTVFLNGSPVDDPASATIPDGGTLALSGAMPGLVGAAMRSGGCLGLLRSGITHRETEKASQAEGTITVKLFNRIMQDLGMAFLNKGILVPRGELLEFFSGLNGAFWRQCSVRVNGRKYDTARLMKGKLPEGGELAILTVQCADTDG